MFGTRILTYNREEIENFIKKYPDTKDVFEKCGNFLKDNYLILANENEDNSPLYQLELSFRIIIANKRNIICGSDLISPPRRNPKKFKRNNT